MKLSLLHESAVTSGAIAMRPAVLGDKGTTNALGKSKNLVGESDGDRWYLQYSKLPNVKLNESQSRNIINSLSEDVASTVDIIAQKLRHGAAGSVVSWIMAATPEQIEQSTDLPPGTGQQAKAEIMRLAQIAGQSPDNTQEQQHAQPQQPQAAAQPADPRAGTQTIGAAGPA